jgi:hypothetical protein
VVRIKLETHYSFFADDVAVNKKRKIKDWLFEKSNGLILLRIEKSKGLQPLFAERSIFELCPYYTDKTRKSIQCFDLFLLRPLFHLLIEENASDGFKGDGYISIPKLFYNKCIKAHTRPKSLYRAELYALMNKENGVEWTSVAKKDFVHRSMPEMVNNRGHLIKPFKDLFEELNRGMAELACLSNGKDTVASHIMIDQINPLVIVFFNNKF